MSAETIAARKALMLSWNEDRYYTLNDLTPEPLTATGVGPWVQCCGKPGFVHIELSDTTAAAATVTIEGSNTKQDKGAATISESISLSGAGVGSGITVLSGVRFIRIRVSSITGTDAAVTATASFM